MSNFDKQVQRNLTGIELEKEGKEEEAIKLYEENVKECFDGSHPYNRLVTLYRKRKMILDEFRILEKAIFVFKNIVQTQRSDRIPKLKKYEDRLNKLKKHISYKNSD